MRKRKIVMFPDSTYLFYNQLTMVQLLNKLTDSFNQIKSCFPSKPKWLDLVKSILFKRKTKLTIIRKIMADHYCLKLEII